MKRLNSPIRINIWEMPALNLYRMNGYTYWNYVVVLFNYSKEITKLHQNQAMAAPFKSSQPPTTRQPTIWITENIAKCYTKWKYCPVIANWGNSNCIKIFQKPSVWLNFSQTSYGMVRNEEPLTATTVQSKTILRVKCVCVEQGAIFQKRVLLTQ
jgi:uncharacterized membrane protein YoaT (DUF817 family)